MFFFPTNGTVNIWVLYVDPSTSLLVVIVILFTTIPLLREVLVILLQSAPHPNNVATIKDGLTQIDGVISIHDLHIWQLGKYL